MALGVAHAKRNMDLGNRCNALLIGTKDRIFISVHNVWAMLVSLVTNKLTLVLLLAPTVLLSECNTPA